MCVSSSRSGQYFWQNITLGSCSSVALYTHAYEEQMEHFAPPGRLLDHVSVDRDAAQALSAELLDEAQVGHQEAGLGSRLCRPADLPFAQLYAKRFHPHRMIRCDSANLPFDCSHRCRRQGHLWRWLRPVR